LVNPNPQAPVGDPELCATQAQTDACKGVADGVMCNDNLNGTCYGGVCISPKGCGNGWIDPSEGCDDGNNTAGDGCSADCTSLEVCGNGIIDPVVLVSGVEQPNEQCDDGNTFGHDGCGGVCRQEQPIWQPYPAFTQQGRVGGAIVYDSARDRVVLFGGEI